MALLVVLLRPSCVQDRNMLDQDFDSLLLSSHLHSLPHTDRVLRLAGHHHTMEYWVYRRHHLPMLAHSSCMDQKHAQCCLYRLQCLLGGLRCYQHPHRRGDPGSTNLDRCETTPSNQRPSRSVVRLHLGWIVSLDATGSTCVRANILPQRHNHQHPEDGGRQSIRSEQGRHYL